MIRQIRFFYPKANIHVLTDEHLENRDCVIHYRPNLEHSVLCKFEIFGLLNQPAMYMDCDMLMLKPFAASHLRSNGPFNLYKSYVHRLDVPYTFPYKHYNSGIVWIPKPDKSIPSRLIQLHAEYFTDEALYLKNDEYAIARFVYENNLRMEEHNDVNQFRHQFGADLPDTVQTVHYPTDKHLLLADYKRFGPKRLHL